MTDSLRFYKLRLNNHNNFILPQLDELISFEAFVAQQQKGYIAHCNTGEKIDLADIAPTEQSNCILIGPEGDFSLDEIVFAQKNNFQPISLGSQRLRTETAALVACHTLSLIHRNI